MALIETWDESKPAGSRALSLGDNDIREDKRAVRERLAVEHNFFDDEAGETNIGIHKLVTLLEQASHPAQLANTLRIYSKLTGSYSELYSRHENESGQQLSLNGKLWIAALDIASAAQGDIITRGASTFQRLATGTSGQYLTTDGTDITWGSISAVSAGTQIGYAHAEDGAYQTFSYSTAFPGAGGIPQITEGGEYSEINVSYTPTTIGNLLLVRAVIQQPTRFGNGATQGSALFRTGTNDALGVAKFSGPSTNLGGSGGGGTISSVIEAEYTVTAVEAHAFVVRVSDDSITTAEVNGANSGQDYGGKLLSSLTVLEIKQ